MASSSGATRSSPGRSSDRPPLDPRQAAYEVLRSVEEKGAWADRALDGVLRRHQGLDERDRALATEVVYGVLRRRGTLDQALRPFSRKALDRLDPEILRILRIGAYQILLLDRVPDHAAVSVSVDLAQRLGRPGSGRFVNAVLRSLCREKAQEDRDSVSRRGRQAVRAGRAEGGEGADVDFPAWLVELWTGQLGVERAQELLAALLEPPGILLRANSLKVSRDELIERLGREGLLAERAEGIPSAVRLLRGGDVRKTRSFAQGLCIQQEGASQLVVELLDPRAGEMIADLCAAPGLKSTHIAARMGNAGVLVSMDRNFHRLRELRSLSSLLGASIAKAVCADAARPESLCLRDGTFDRVLVDAPCSGLGVLRRSPEKKWRPVPDFGALVALQERLLAAAAGLVRKGGVLLYCTCTVNARENEEIVRRFLASRPAFVLEDVSALLPAELRSLASEEGYFCSWRKPASFDYFFAARLRRAS
ncbi:MAG: 16S rRNA (cytosine(967)-C(5))-methyltransferase RsmB [bacterium]